MNLYQTNSDTNIVLIKLITILKPDISIGYIFMADICRTLNQALQNPLVKGKTNGYQHKLKLTSILGLLIMKKGIHLDIYRKFVRMLVHPIKFVCMYIPPSSLFLCTSPHQVCFYVRPPIKFVRMYLLALSKLASSYLHHHFRLISSFVSTNLFFHSHVRGKKPPQLAERSEDAIRMS